MDAKEIVGFDYKTLTTWARLKIVLTLLWKLPELYTAVKVVQSLMEDHKKGLDSCIVSVDGLIKLLEVRI